MVSAQNHFTYIMNNDISLILNLTDSTLLDTYYTLAAVTICPVAHFFIYKNLANIFPIFNR